MANPRAKKFEKSRLFQLGVPDWKILLSLAYDGPQSKYDISKKYKIAYPVVHRATMSLKKTGWIKVVKQQLSKKDVPTKIYGLTSEGLLWVFSRLPKNRSSNIG